MVIVAGLVRSKSLSGMLEIFSFSLRQCEVGMPCGKSELIPVREVEGMQAGTDCIGFKVVNIP